MSEPSSDTGASVPDAEHGVALTRDERPCGGAAGIPVHHVWTELEVLRDGATPTWIAYPAAEAAALVDGNEVLEAVGAYREALIASQIALAHALDERDRARAAISSPEAAGCIAELLQDHEGCCSRGEFAGWQPVAAAILAAIDHLATTRGDS